MRHLYIAADTRIAVAHHPAHHIRIKAADAVIFISSDPFRLDYVYIFKFLYPSVCQTEYVCIRNYVVEVFRVIPDQFVELIKLCGLDEISEA